MQLLPLSVCWVALASAVLAAPPDPWTSSDLIAPAALAARLKADGARPPVYYVGFGILYRSKHIPGAIFTGPTAKQEGLEALRAAVIKLPRTTELVIYCGCCPWTSCPNIRPAFLMLRELGFRRVLILDLPTSFLKDWIDKGYPVEQGHS